MRFDLVIRGGTVIDGSGAPRYRADVGISGNRITAIGRIHDRGDKEIDAEGMMVAPGFIEVHSHMDAQVFWDSLGTCSAWHGITTTVMGNCGFTIAPSRDGERDLCLRSLERAEAIPRSVLLSGIPWGWETFPEYLDAVDAVPKGINYACHIGHSALRSYVMGERAFEEAATVDDLSAMSREVEAAIGAGAIGFSTSRSPSHTTSDDRPVASRQADWDEVRSLVRVMSRLGTGMLEITPDNYADPASRAHEQATLRDLAVESGRPTTFTVFNLPAQRGAWLENFSMIEETAARGGRMIAQVHSRQFQEVNSFRTRLPFDQLPEWRDLRAMSLPEQRHALEEPGMRMRLVEQAMNGPYKNVTSGMESRPPDWERLYLFDSPLGPYQSVSDLAREQGSTPVDVMIEAALASNFDQFFVQPIANHDMADVLRMMRHPHAVVGGSDSGAHVNQIIDSSIPTFLLAYWVRQKQAFTLEEAVRMLSFDPARLWGFMSRGLIAPGMIADLVVFDPDRVGPAMPSVDRDLPSGAQRLKQNAIGISATIVGGQILLKNGTHTGALPGQLLRAGRPQGSSTT